MRKFFSFLVKTKSRRLDCFIRPVGDSYLAKTYVDDWSNFGHSFEVHEHLFHSRDDVLYFIDFYKRFYGSSCTVF